MLDLSFKGFHYALFAALEVVVFVKSTLLIAGNLINAYNIWQIAQADRWQAARQQPGIAFSSPKW